MLNWVRPVVVDVDVDVDPAGGQTVKSVVVFGVGAVADLNI